MYTRIGSLLCILFLLPAVSSAQMNISKNELRVSFDLEQHMLIGTSTITVPETGSGKEAVISLSGLAVTSATLNSLPLVLNPAKHEIPLQSFYAGDVVRIEYTVAAVQRPETDTTENAGVVAGNVIGQEGIVLTGNWYPAVNGPTAFALTATVPATFESISEAEEIVSSDAPGGLREFAFHFRHPLLGIHFVAGRYVISRETHKGIDVYSYFLPEDSGLANTYIEYTKKYLDLYEKQVATYPYRRFSVVENVLPTGYALPTFTLLGQEVVRLPFIVETSLGHEILHQWFGNCVSVDDSKGNWSEGLVTYLADHQFEDRKGLGSAYRKQMIAAFQSAVTPENDFPLASFSGRTNRSSAAIGYSKSAMVFHMLKELVGDDIFTTALRSFAADNMFSTASWLTIRSAFESASKQNLDWFFTQWVEEKGAPELELHNVVVSYQGATAVVSFDLSQKGRPYKLLLPVDIRTREGTVRKKISVDKGISHVEIEVGGSPVELVIDGQYDVFRKLSGREYYPLLARLINDNQKIAVVPEGREKEFSRAVDVLKEQGFSVRNETQITHDDLTKSSLLLIGSANPLAARLFGKLKRVDGELSVVVRDNPYATGSVIALLDCDAPDDIGRYVPRLMHYGRYSTIAFKNGRNILKETTAKEEGLRAALVTPVPGVDISRMIDLPGIIEKVGNRKIIYAGEAHDRFEHHRAQFEIIRGLYRKNKKIAIGMEMFQQPFQKVLDDYIAGTIEEREFLKKSEYFKRWSFDYNLYREILLYAREYKIPVVALNIRKEIVSKVSKSGLYGLTKEELSEVPADMDLSDGEYRSRLKEFFLGHTGNAERNFDFFFQAQVLWDEAMAHALDAFIRRNPDHQVVVLAGGGHLSFGSGIPRRAYRLNSLDYAIVLNSEEPHGQIANFQIADFILFPEPIAYRESLRLMVQFKEEDRKLVITDFPRESISEKAGLKKGDIILSLDGGPVQEVDDVKIHLLYKKKGDSVVVRVSRNRFLLGDREMTFTITF